MPDRILKFLEEMDTVRDDAANSVDEFFKTLNIDAIIKNPEKSLKAAVLIYLKRNNDLFNRGRIHGKKLVTKLKRRENA